ncbi:adhesion G-protein coupled receptor V1 [Pyxicephalus adspersus]|uniref:adhesion G-protein coupled receptor V1 n=1 Tax=Pyxicephalus adspersus TaxID=30357 RepID=UPI003B5B493F
MSKESWLGFHSGTTGMPCVSSPPLIFFLVLFTAISAETQVQFAGQTDFFVNETATTVIRLVIERTGVPVNITVVVELVENDTGDFIATATAAFIPDWETNRTVYISVCDDDFPEADETFHFILKIKNPPTNTSLGVQKVASVTILSNDNAFGIISLNMTSHITVTEPQGRNQTLALLLLREKGTYETVTVTFEIDGGPNPAEDDIYPAKGNITFSAGRSIFVYNLTVLDDQIPENDENFTLKLTNVYGGAEINGTRDTLHLTIWKNDSPVRFVQSSYTVPETNDVITIPVLRGKALTGMAVGSDDSEVLVNYRIVTGNSTSSAQLQSDFLDLQQNKTIIFPPKVQEITLKFQIVDDPNPEIAESFQIQLLEDTLQGDAVLQNPCVVHVTIEANDKPHGVLSINSAIFAQTIIIDEDRVSRYEGINIVRNGGTHGNVSVSWIIKRNSKDPSHVTSDIVPDSGVLRFSQGEMMAAIPLTVVGDDEPEEAEAYLLQILPNTVQGGADVGTHTELVFYIQDSDDVYGLIQLHAIERQKIVSTRQGRYLTLSFVRQGGTKGDVKLIYTAMYIPAGPVDPERAKEGVLNVSLKNNVTFLENNSVITVNLSIRNDAFLQNGAHFYIQLESCELLRPIPLVPPISPRLGPFQNVTLKVTSDIANGEIGFTTNRPYIVSEPENVSSEMVSIDLHRDGTGEDAIVYWSLKPSGPNANDITFGDLSPFNGSVTFFSGQSDTVIIITIKADEIPELNETVIISLDRVSAENQVIKSGFTSCELTILGNDDPGGVFGFSQFFRGPYSVKEGDSVELRISRSRGALVKQFLRYTIEPKDNNEFYGNTGILEFQTGEKEIVITLLTRMDGIPELDEMYSVVLSPHGEFPITLGDATRVNITILKNDDPHGVIEFVTAGQVETINESKGDDINTASFDITRKQGSFGNINVSWTINPSSTSDVFPTNGIVQFKDQEKMKTISVSSTPDEVPEEREIFTVIIFNPTGGARLGDVTTATLMINKNDDAVFFAEPVIVLIDEGQVANFTIMRNGSADFVSSVAYITVSGTASAEDGDFDYIPGDILIFEVGQRVQNILVHTNEDDIPETDEFFYLLLLNATGDTVVSENGNATVVIKANDDPNGIFHIEPVDKTVEEGSTNHFKVMRERGNFGSVLLHWQIFQNGSILQPDQEFYESQGSLLFNDREEFKYITLHAVPDRIPEFNEFYILKLVNISGGHPGSGGKLAETNLTVTVIIPFNDDPFGVFVIGSESQDREVAEDVLSVDDMRYITNLSVWRNQGTFGHVRVGWEILSESFKGGFPPMLDLILLASFPPSVQLQAHMRRHHSGTDALFFSGEEGAFGIIEPQYFDNMNNTLTNFTFSAWFMPLMNTNGFILSKDNDNGTIYFGVKVETNNSYIMVLLYYVTYGSNTTYFAKAGVPKFLEENVWVHILITLDDGFIEFYIDGILVPGGIKSLKGEGILNGPGTVRIGAGANGSSRFTGLLQDVRLYEERLSRAEINELHATPAKSDLHPVSGYLEYRQGEIHKSFVIAARNDTEEEGEEVYVLKLVSVHGGARIPEENTTATIRIQKSDNANGLFGFTGPCIPQSTEEDSTISCVVERTRGALDTVYLFYSIIQTDPGVTDDSMADFTSRSGNITFLPSQRSKVLNLHVLDDDIPELAEHFQVILTNAVSADGKVGSLPTSGASIDPSTNSEDVTINASDHPYGLLQFSVDPPPKRGDNMTIPAKTAPTIRVKEEVGQVKLLVVRAQGLLGTIRVEYRTVSMTAFSAQDYQETADTLKFQPGERYKYIYVNITDNSVPELAKSFRVELWNAEGEVAELFRDDGFASGDGDMEFFLPAVHHREHLELTINYTAMVHCDHRETCFQKCLATITSDNLISFSIERLHGTYGRVMVEWFANGSVADIFPTSGMVTFSEGQTLTTITVTVLADSIAEMAETVMVILTKVTTINIKDPSKGAILDLSRSKAVLTILPNDSPHGVVGWHVNSSSIKVNEPEGNATIITLQVTREQGFVGDIAVYLQSLHIISLPLENRATENEDYIINDKIVIIRENNIFAQVKLTILPENIPELNESFLLNITDVQFVNSSVSSGLPMLKRPGKEICEITILENDDPRGVFQFNVTKTVNGAVLAYEVPPPQNVLRLPVVRQAGNFGIVTVYWEALPITASRDDFTPSSGNLSFSDGQSTGVIEIIIVDDTFVEYLETFNVSLKQVTNGAILGSEVTVVVNIPPNDSPLGLFGFETNRVFISEPQRIGDPAGEVTLTVVRSPGGQGAVKIIWILEEAGQYDLSPLNGTLNFNETDTRKSFTLKAIQDGLLEGMESFTIQLASTDYSVISPVDGTATVVITGDAGAAGIIGIAPSSLHVLIGEPSGNYNGTAHISLIRGPGIFGEVTVYWNITPAYTREFVDTSGMVTLRDRQSAAVIIIQAVDDDVPEEKSFHHLYLSKISEGGIINESMQLANITMASSDLPYGLFQFSQTLLQISEETQWVNMTISRTGGTHGSVLLNYQTKSGSALSGLDYTKTFGEFLFRPNETKKDLSIEIKNDALPEGPEDFFVIITEVKLVGGSYDHTIRENGLQIDQPPLIGYNSVVRIIILLNDNAEGVIEFDPQFTAIQVEEDVGIILIPVLRTRGTYGYVTADLISHDISATAGIDYAVSNTTVVFLHGQNQSFINISIMDDEESEFAEQLEIRLVGASGGAVLGARLLTLITIAKSDSPNGAVRFLNQSQIILPNPNSTITISLVLERTGGHIGEAQILWHILGPNSKAILSPDNDDFSGPLNGSFHFSDGEGGLRHITLTILPHGEIEVQEKFIVVLSIGAGITEVDPKAGNVTLIIQKFGDPNGIVKFAAESLLRKNYTEPQTTDGPLNITFPINRVQGTQGNITVFWKLTSQSDITGDFSVTSGWVAIPDKENIAEIVIQLLPDDVPELDELCMLQLTSVEGGADLDGARSVLWFTVLANDDPHGVFYLDPAIQTVIINSDLERFVQTNVTRLGGTFGNVTVEYQVSFGKRVQENLTGIILGSVYIQDGASYGISIVPISNQVLLLPGFNFTLELTNVILLGQSTYGKPYIHKGQKPTPVTIPKEAANSEVGFESVAFRLTNITSGMGHAVVYREGSYGSVTVSWRAGYPPGFMPNDIRLGKLLPESGVVVFTHGEDRKSIPLYLEANTSGPEGFAVQLIGLSSSVPSGARLKSGFTYAEFEPMGVFQFSPSSRYIVVQEDIKTVSLHVERLFGFHGNNTKLTFTTISGSAKEKEDFVPILNGELIFRQGQTSSIINISIINDKVYELNELFYVNLTSVESTDFYQLGPRLHIDYSLSSLTILANDFMSGLLSIGPAITYINEDSNNSALNTVTIQVKRTHGSSGIVHVILTTFGARKAKNGLQGLPFEQSHMSRNISWATEDLDFEEQAILITMLDGQSETQVSIKILDDDEPEGLEILYVFLTNPQGGAQIMEGRDETGFSAFSTIIIRGNDLQNGILGFAAESLDGLTVDEDSSQRSVQLVVLRQANRAFEDVKIYWRATFNKTSVELYRGEVNLVNELQAVSGYTICTAGQTECLITVEIKDDKVPEFETYFFVELYDVSAGASLNSSIRFAKIFILESDSPRGLISFAQGSRVVIAHKKTTLISLQISRVPNTSQTISVEYIIMELRRSEVIGHTVIYPAVAGRDFFSSEGTLTFESGQKTFVLDISLTPDTASLNPYPKRFQVLLTNPSGGAKIDPLYGTANITIVSDSSSQFTWGLLDQLHQPYDENVLNRVLQTLNNQAGSEFSQEQLGATMTIMEKIVSDGRTEVLTEDSRILFYDILCSLISPDRLDTRGYSPLIEVAELYAYSLLTGVTCSSPGVRGKTVFDTCPYISIHAYHWYPQQINRHRFDGKNGDTIQLPERLLPVFPENATSEGSCRFVQFIEYSSQQWFLTGGEESALNNKILSVSVKGNFSYQLDEDNEVVYRIRAAGGRIVPSMSLCLLWNQASERWLSNAPLCRVVSDTTEYVECACSHMSSYAVFAHTDDLSSYNEAFFCAGFICISGFTLAILSQIFCTRSSMFAAKLLTHMMVACLGTQISFLASAYISRELSNESCAGLAAVTHYFYLSQFIWMFIQAVNFWYILVMNDEHAERRHLVFFILGWGLPAVVVALHLVILKSLYHKSMTDIYGLVHGDMCFIPNIYAALFTAALVPLICLVVVLVVFIHAYQVTQQWKAYDDVFRGRPNATEIPLILYLFALISVTWLWGGLHVAYRHLWMLVLFIIFNSLQGLYVFVVYFIMHNQLCCPVKASYSIETDGHRSPASAFFTPSSGMPPAGAEISKSTQNLISAMEEISSDWERSGSQEKHSPQNGTAYTPSGGYSNGSLVADEELQEFDDLIFVLKAGSGMNISDTESCHGSQDGSGMANSQIVELRRIPIADTHL